MRFLLYNIRYATASSRPRWPWSGYWRSTSRHLKTITEFVRGLDPDVVGLVEVDSGSFRTGRKHQAEEMARELGHYHSYAPKYDRATRVASLPVLAKQGNAFLAKDTITGERFHYFTKGVKRLVIELEMGGLTIFLVHLSLGFKARHRQLAQLYALVNACEGPRIVAGDFNALWGEDEIDLFLAATGLINANLGGAPSFPSWRPTRHLDFVLHSEDIEAEVLWIPEVELSDHLPLVFDFQLPGGAGCDSSPPVS